MSDHKKPTQEELDEGMQSALDRLDRDDEEEELEKEVEKVEEEELETTDISDEEDDEEEAPDDEEEEVEDKEDKKGNSWKKKYSESSREAQVLYAKNKKVNEAINQASELPEPTEEDLKKEYGDWDEMTATEQRFAKDNYINKKRFEIIHGATKEFRDIEAWNEKVEKFLDDPKTLVDNPNLEGRLDEFREFVSKPTRRGVDFDDLVGAFSYNLSAKKPKPKRGKMFPDGSGGGSAKGKRNDGKLSVEQGRQLMKADYKRYKKLLIAGKIANI